MGYNDTGSSISNSYSTGSVSGTSFVGGLAGVNYTNSAITNSYSTASVSGSGARVGGLVGDLYSASTINNSYSVGTVVSGGGYVGGLLGYNIGGTITNSFWNTTTSGQATSVGGTGLTNAQMQQFASFAAWNTPTTTIANTGGSGAVWRIYEGHTYPLLNSFLTPLSISASDTSVTYNGGSQSGNAFTLIGNVFGAAATQRNVGFYNGYYSNQQGYDLTGDNLTITAKSVTLTAPAISKTYDTGLTYTTQAADLTAMSTPLVGGDSVTAATFAFADKNVGTANKIVTSSGVTVSDGNGGNNYVITYANGTNGTINAANLSIGGVTTSGRVYDSTTTAILGGTPTVTAIGSDTISVNSTGSGTFANPNVGVAKSVAVTGFTLTGPDAGNYLLVQPTGLTADITARPLTVTANTQTKTYGSADPVLTYAIGPTTAGAGLVGSDSLSGNLTRTAGENVVGGPYAITLGSLSGSANYSLAYTGNALTINPYTVSLTGIRTYDGTANFAAGAFTIGTLAGTETLTLGGTGTVASKNAGSYSVALNSLALGNGTGLASNYTLTGGNHTALITVRPLSTWTASSSGLWSNPANWDALPDGQNVLAVTIPSGGSYQVSYDGGSTTLQNLNSSQNLIMGNGTLTIGTALTTTGLSQTGGTIAGAGSLSVTNSFNQSGGSINLAGAATLTQATGNLNIADLKASSVRLTALSAGISQTGPIVTSSLTTSSATGTILNSTNQIANFSAVNSSSGNIELTNTASPLTIAAITQSGTGSIVISNTGTTITGSEPVTSGGPLTITALSPLTIGSGGLTAAGDITLVASLSTGADSLTVNGPVASSAGNITLKASNRIIMGTGGSTAAPLGTVTLIDVSGTSSPGTAPAAAPTATPSTDTCLAAPSTHGCTSVAPAATVVENITNQVVKDTSWIETTPVSATGLMPVALLKGLDEPTTSPPVTSSTAQTADGATRDQSIATDKDTGDKITDDATKKNEIEKPASSGDTNDVKPKKNFCN